MVRVAAAVVPDCGTNVLGHAVDAAQQILDALRLQLGMLVQRRIEIRDVSLMMLAVVNLHRPRIDVRLERIEWVWERGERVSHRSVPPGGPWRPALFFTRSKACGRA